MDNPFSHPSFKDLVDDTKEIFRKKDIFFRLSRHVTFVCGGNNSDSFRFGFLKYLAEHDHGIDALQAEDAVNDLLSHNNPEFINLAEFEDLIGNIFDSVLIFPESEGSIAELGFFSNSPQVQKKVVVANNLKYQKDSFINLGPIARIDDTSAFKPHILLDPNAPDFDLVRERLAKFSSKRKHRDRFSYTNFKKLAPKPKAAAVLEIISIFRCVPFEGLEYLIKKIFRTVDAKELRRLVSILSAIGLVSRVGDNHQYLIIKDGKSTFLEIDNFNTDDIKARTTFTLNDIDSKYLNAVRDQQK